MALTTTGLKKRKKKYDAQGKLIRAKPTTKKPNVKKPVKKKAPPQKKWKPGDKPPKMGGPGWWHDDWDKPIKPPIGGGTGPIDYGGGPTKPKKKKPGGPKPKPKLKPKPPKKKPVPKPPKKKKAPPKKKVAPPRRRPQREAGERGGGA